MSDEGIDQLISGTEIDGSRLSQKRTNLMPGIWIVFVYLDNTVQTRT